MAQTLHRHIKIPWLTCSGMNQIPDVNNSAAWNFAAGVTFTKESEKMFVWTFDKIILDLLAEARLTENHLGLLASASVLLKPLKTWFHSYVVMRFDQISLTAAKQSISCHQVITQMLLNTDLYKTITFFLM